MMGNQRLATGKLPGPLGAWFCAFLCLVSLSASVRVNAQDVAEAARQEKARKAAQGKPKAKVYTDEDLKQPQILTPEDRARAQSGKKDPAYSPNQLPPQSVDAVNDPPPESLGEIARRYRREKAARQAEQAVKTQSSSPFKMDLPKAVLAAPVLPRVVPAVPPALRARPERSAAPAASARRDPFSRAFISEAPRSSSSVAAPVKVAPVIVAPRASSPVVPSPIPPSEPVVPSRARTAVTIQSGDSLWKLAHRYLGRGSRWHELLAVNPGLPEPTRIQPGRVLVIPETIAGKHPRPPASLQVQKGDSLWKIATEQCGSAASIQAIKDLNKDVLKGDTVVLNTKLRLPNKVASAN